MSCQDSSEVSFHDVSDYFSEEEWKLLHDWQKNLYKNVMKEIHHALLSLGPLITTTIVSVRAKEIEDLCPVNNQDLKRKCSINLSPHDTSSSTVFSINRDDRLHLQTSWNTEAGKATSRHSTGHPIVSNDLGLRKEDKPVPVFFDHLGEEIQGSPTDPSADHEGVLFRIKHEEEPYCEDYQEFDKLQNASNADCDGTLKNKDKVEDTRRLLDKTAAGRTNMDMPFNYEKGTHSRTSLWSELSQESRRDEATHCESGVSDPTQICANPRNKKVHAPETFNPWDSTLCHANLIACQPNLQKKLIIYSCTECKKTFSKKEYLTRHKRKHMGVRPYQCTECGKSFRKKDNLFVHKRTHTGERPYRCTMCDRSFSQKGVLNRHQITHMVDRPYHCPICEKSFCQKGGLIRHQVTHKTMML
ncbi:uncharacterized protein LOC144818763 [Lissotriton helveticus]